MLVMNDKRMVLKPVSMVVHVVSADQKGAILRVSYERVPAFLISRLIKAYFHTVTSFLNQFGITKAIGSMPVAIIEHISPAQNIHHTWETDHLGVPAAF